MYSTNEIYHYRSLHQSKYSRYMYISCCNCYKMYNCCMHVNYNNNLMFSSIKLEFTQCVSIGFWWFLLNLIMCRHKTLTVFAFLMYIGPITPCFLCKRQCSQHMHNVYCINIFICRHCCIYQLTWWKCAHYYIVFMFVSISIWWLASWNCLKVRIHAKYQGQSPIIMNSNSQKQAILFLWLETIWKGFLTVLV